MKHHALSTAVLLALGLSAPVAALADTHARKDIVVVSPQQPAAVQLQVQVKPLKTSFNVGEPIRLEVQGNKDIYTYLFRVDAAGNSRLLLPADANAPIMIKANTRNLLPTEGSLVLAANAPGAETLLVVTSTKPIAFAASKAATGQSAAELQQQFQSKGVGWADSNQPVNTTVTANGQESVSTLISVNILPAPASSPQPGGDAVGISRPGVMANGLVTVTTDKRIYTIGEPITVLYGSTAAGYLSVYADEENGQSTLIKRERIKAGQLATLTIEAMAPAGKTTLRAYVSATAADTDHPTKAVGPRTVAAPAADTVAVHTIQVNGR